MHHKAGTEQHDPAQLDHLPAMGMMLRTTERASLFGSAGHPRLPMRTFKLATAGSLWLWAILCFDAPIARAGDCPKTSEEIVTDRPDVTNSSIVVPRGSLQSENGIDLTKEAGIKVIDGTNTRLRFGIADCFELLVDLPTYFSPLNNSGKSGFSDVAPAAKWQISPLPGTLAGR
jgi:hypothetical protein